VDVRTNITSQLTFDALGNNDPVWSPASDAVMFENIRSGKRDFYVQTLGSREGTLAYGSTDDPKWLDDWSRDGKFVLFHLPQPARLFAIEMTGNASSGEPRLLTEARVTIDGAHFSPDGRWVAYMSNDSGGYEVWVAPFPAFDRRRQVSSHGGGQVMWRSDMRELFYLSPAGEMMSVAITPGSGAKGDLEFTAPTRLFQSPLPRPNLTVDLYSVTPDGKRFLFIQPQTDAAANTPAITVVLNGLSGIGNK